MIQVFRDKVIKKLNDLNIGAGIHYQCNKFYFLSKELSFKKKPFPIAEKVGENNISLPLSPAMRKYDAKTVVEALKKFFMNDTYSLKTLFNIEKHTVIVTGARTSWFRNCGCID